MAQKQFKIGLSNTNKQNMAQDVYERVLALTFNEYDTTTEYEVGDFVVYNDQLYKCIGATSGAWDSTKWQQATLQDLLDDVEGAVASVADKANVDGNYPTMTVGVADQLSPYDENSGDDQDEPFSFQATGTGNGTQPDFATGSIALMKEKQGNTVVVNQLVSDTYNVPTTTTPSGNCNLGATGLTAGHKYLLAFELTADVDNGNGFNFGYYNTSYQFVTIKSNLLSGSTSKGYKMFIITVDSVSNYLNTQILNSSNGASEVSTDHKSFIDLTQWFNGDIPQDLLDNPKNFFRYYQGSLAYNEGELVNANGRYIKCIGRQQWDEEWENGVYVYWGDNPTGEPTDNAEYIRSKNLIRVNPNTDYYFKKPHADGSVGLYDAQGNFIKPAVLSSPSSKDRIFNTENASFVKFYCKSSTYENNITISIYYEDESGYDQYYPYQVLTNNDTGNEVLRSAGSVKDSKAPDGTITRRIGVVDLGSLTWSYDTNHFAASFNLAKASGKSVCDSPLFATTYENRSYSTNHLIWVHNTGEIFATYQETTDPATFKTAMSGVYLFYELAEPTTEQGTPYSENLVIDDFGSMDFGSYVPQGALIFYPVDYKAFVDTLYNYTDGTPSNIALKSDLSAEQSARETQDVALLNAVGGTLRQVLCLKETLDFEDTDAVDLGELTWTYSELDGNPAFTATISGAKTTSKTISTIYENQDGYQSTNKTYTLQRGETGTIWVIDNSYTDADAFKAAVQGVIVAFEKA